MSDYFCRADGSALNKSAAIGPPSDASKCMTLTVASGESFDPGDNIYLSDQGGIFLEILTVPSSGSVDNPISFLNVSGETPIISGSDTEATPSYERRYAIYISSKDNIIISGLECRYTGGVSAVYGECICVVGTSDNIEVQDCHLHHNQNEGLKLFNTAIVYTYNNIFHDNLDSDVSLHDDASLYMSGDEMYNSQYGIENIGNSYTYADNINIHDCGSHCIFLYINAPSLELYNSTICNNNKVPGHDGINFSHDAYGIVGAVGKGNDISECSIGVQSGGTGVVQIVGNTITGTGQAGVRGAVGTTYTIENTFKDCQTYSVVTQPGAVNYVFRNLNTDDAGAYSNFAYASGEFYIIGNLIEGTTYSYAVLAGGTIDPSSVIANNFVNACGLRAIDAANLIFNIYNNAVRNCVQYNFYRIGSAVVKNNIGDRNDLPSGDGNVNNATFSSIFESLVIADSAFALPIVGGLADGSGIDPGVSGFIKYFNDVKVNKARIDIGAKGLRRAINSKLSPFSFGFGF